ncbi:DNA phosphorothioation-associated protein 4 [Bradyrhizobium sp. AUGA SZCCT0177]|uniref:DNA phosphorothioation-associated protein 4 n=1 Tax=Bradyrhizobium sp. AUGA SZCCT0177 TaxID=2807665 RepID=UPI001BA5B3AC|nr:DNA phosphorothioation-associated protein 4 [Bradyrhizobium sp. AUGA SZCCT0177]MBR1285379.1 DNA phosphorothioation-associated protein 4 [Bradyrhizobium sp. AUGA SZCCT0177]
MADRVRRPQRFDDFLSELTKGREVFQTYKDALVFAACLGFKRGRKVQFDKTGEPINLHTFSGQFDAAVMNAIAIADVGDPFVMANNREEEKIRIFEEYACGGLEIMEGLLGQAQLSRHEALSALIMDEEKSGGILDIITGLAKG